MKGKQFWWYPGRDFGLSEAKEDVNNPPYAAGVVRPHPTCPKYQKEKKVCKKEKKIGAETSELRNKIHLHHRLILLLK